MAPRFRSTASLLAALALTATACDDPADPCDDAGCGIEGIDLALVVAEIDWTADQRVDDRVGGRLVQPGDELTFRYRILNRGTEASEPTVLQLGTFQGSNNFGEPVGLRSIEIPALGPGQHLGGSMTLDAPESAGLRTDELLAGFWLGGLLGGVVDADVSNHDREFRYHLASGYAIVHLYVDEGDTLHLGEADSVFVAVINPSPVGMLQGDLHLAFCALVRYPGYMEPDCGETGFAVQSIADLDTTTTDVYELEITLPTDALPIQDFDVVGLRVCVFDDEPVQGLDLVHQMSQGVCGDQAVTIVQDLSLACAPPVVSLPETLDAAGVASDCERQFSTYDVWGFDAASSGLHTITPVAGDLAHVLVFGPGHERITVSSSGEFFLPEAGRYHVVVLPATANHIFAIE